MPAYAVCGTFIAAVGAVDELTAHLLEAAAALRDVPSCRLYVVSRVPGEPDAVRVMEMWDTPEAHRASLELEAVRDLIARARPLIAAMPERLEMVPVGGKGVDAQH